MQRCWADAERNTGERGLGAVGPGVVSRAGMCAHGVVHLLTWPNVGLRHRAGSWSPRPRAAPRGPREAAPPSASSAPTAARRPAAARLRPMMCRTVTTAMATTMATGPNHREAVITAPADAYRVIDGPGQPSEGPAARQLGTSRSTGSSSRSLHSSTKMIRRRGGNRPGHRRDLEQGVMPGRPLTPTAIIPAASMHLTRRASTVTTPDTSSRSTYPPITCARGRAAPFDNRHQ